MIRCVVHLMCVVALLASGKSLAQIVGGGGGGSQGTAVYDYTVLYGDTLNVLEIDKVSTEMGEDPHTSVITIDNYDNDIVIVSRSLFVDGILVYEEELEIDFDLVTLRAQATCGSDSTGWLDLDWESGEPVSPNAAYNTIETTGAAHRAQLETDMGLLVVQDYEDITLIDNRTEGDCGFSKACCVVLFGPNGGVNGPRCGECCDTAWPRPGPGADCTGATDALGCCLSEAAHDLCRNLCNQDIFALHKAAIDEAACFIPFNWLF